MTGGSKFEVPKFDGHGNFGLRQTRVKHLLAQQGIQKGLRAEKPKGMEDDDWQDLQERAAGTIQLCLVDEVMYHVMHLKSADEIWKKLESQFMSKTLTTKLYLKQRLYGLKMQEGTDLGQHVNIFNQVVTDLASLEAKIEDEDKAMILLCLLPPSYEHMVTTLTYGKETIKTEEITSALLAHNQQKQKSGESSSQSDSLCVKGNQDRGRKHVRENSGNRKFRSKSRDKSKGRKTVTCYKCKEQGHFKRDCPKWKKQTADMSSMSANVVQNEESDCSDGDMLSISTTQYDDAWILDFGCSYHIMPNREWFATYKPDNSGSVFLGDDRCCGIVGIGDVKIKMYDGTVRTLCDVRHIPKLKKNLISLGTLHRNGFIPKADEDRETIKIVNGALTVMKGRIAAGNIYKLLGSTVGYKFSDPVEKKTVISRDAVFDEQPMLGSDADKVQVELEHVPAVLDKGESSSSAPNDVDHDVSGPTDVPESYKLARDRVRHTNIQAPVRFGYEDMVAFALTITSVDPCTFQEAVSCENSDRWKAAIEQEMNSIGYKRCDFDCCVYTKSLGDGSMIFLLLYVDDMLIAAKNMRDIIDLKSLLSQEFEMKDLGAAKKILGMEIHRDRGSKKLWLSQKGYVEKVLQRFGMNEAKPVSTPLANDFNLSVDQCPKSDNETHDMVEIPYASAVRCLMYAMVCTRPDLAHAVGQVCKYMSRPGKQHWEAVKWIFRYLKGTAGHGIVFGDQRLDPLVVGYVDSDHAGDLDNRRSTTCHTFTVLPPAGILISKVVYIILPRRGTGGDFSVKRPSGGCHGGIR
ncbi:Uncharacterized mitochondrial protein AtMg00810 [Striga hermonthica]|uniref:Uncharacterized mitochondrial protein AtMg00810 n=1 Tax=Striga hermonthica TaxID=68872 RepID=A0A9N7RL03_STRHE|nr:Uncharacterized mitochondrial protein AtMg00810 [Striga hermonthica]